MSVTSTSTESYIKLRNTLGVKQGMVYDVLREIGPCSNRELAEHMNLPINTITPRIKELRDKEMVVEDGKGFDPKTKRKVILWKAVNACA